MCESDESKLCGVLGEQRHYTMNTTLTTRSREPNRTVGAADKFDCCMQACLIESESLRDLIDCVPRESGLHFERCV